MHLVAIGTSRYTQVWAEDEPGAGGARHRYRVRMLGDGPLENPDLLCASVSFQEGPVHEAGVNGCHHEDLLAIVMHRLQAFQAGEYACPENQDALDALHQALRSLNARTASRHARGVEGTSVI